MSENRKIRFTTNKGEFIVEYLFLRSVSLMMVRSVSLNVNDVRMNLPIGCQIHILITVWGDCHKILMKWDYLLTINTMK